MPTILHRASGMRRTETPNAVMRTLASPTQGSTHELSMWTVHMRAGQQGPLHVFDSEQVWCVLDGEVEISVDDQSMCLEPGDAVVLAAQTRRQVTALHDADMIVCGRSNAIASVPGEAGSRGTPAWIS